MPMWRRNISIPFSTSSAVCTPLRLSPSSTNVMATAGCIPTTTVCASKTRAIAEVLASIRPIKESTMSSEEMSMSTPLALTLAILFVRSSCSAEANWSCMSTWIVTSRKSPILRIGIRSIMRSPERRLLLRGWILHEGCPTAALQRKAQRFGHGGFSRDGAQIDLQMHHRLCDLGADSRNDAVCPHQPGSSNGLEKMLCHQCVNRRHARDVDNSKLGARIDDRLKQPFHHHTRPRAVERANERQGDNAFPYLHYGSGQLEHFLLLATDHFLTGLLVSLRGVETKLIEKKICSPHVFHQFGRIIPAGLAESGKKRLL